MSKLQQNLTKKKRRREEIMWDRLDNTANLFPVIAGETLTNVYRISVTLKEEIQEDLLQEALDLVLPKFSGFNLRLRKGMFWYYFEENGKPAPKVVEEETFPCRYIRDNRNRSYLFRVTYYKKRINLEVFHALTDGMGGLNFLKEITYQYLRLVHPKLREKLGDSLSSETSLNREDSFLKHYTKPKKGQAYGVKPGFQMKGEKLRAGEFAVMHLYINLKELKDYTHEKQITINEFLTALMAYSIYKEQARAKRDLNPIRVSVPVNLRPYFESVTTKNFFVMISAEFDFKDREDASFSEVLDAIVKDMRKKITKENMEVTLSYNVHKAESLVAKLVPLFLKNIAIAWVYRSIAKANTTTVTNIGNIKVGKEYEPWIEQFHAMLSVSRGQYLKGTICSYQDTLVYTFSSIFADTHVQKRFCRTLAEEGFHISIESNGLYY